MLIKFTIENFLSFKERKTLSLEATNITEYKDSTFCQDDCKLLKSAVIYGANSSGKSNLIKAMSKMRRIVMTSAEKSSTYKFDIVPFLLNTSTEKEPSHFEAIFLINKTWYRYGFEMTLDTIHKEWLFTKVRKEEIPLFIRDNEGIGVAPEYTEGMGLESKTRDNALFLSVVDQFNGDIANQLMEWFKNWNTISGVDHEDYSPVTFSLLDEKDSREQLLNFFRALDLGFDQLEFRKEKVSAAAFNKDFPKELIEEIVKDLDGKQIARINTIHKMYDAAGQQVGTKNFDLRERESSGTNKLVDLSGPIFATLASGGILVIDELDAKLHPLLTTAITNLFNSEEYNLRNAQLVFATHDTNLLHYGQFRRDQIYFVEKDHYGASDLYSLIEYREEESDKKVRKDRSFERDYIAGRYGAIPFINNLEKLIHHV